MSEKLPKQTEQEKLEIIANSIIQQGSTALGEHKDTGWNPYTEENRSSWPHPNACQLWLKGWSDANIANGEADSDLYTDGWLYR